MKVTVSELASLIKSVRLMDVSENQLDVEMADYWTRETEKEYNRVTGKIDNISAKGKGYFIYVWYDVSGFDYWVNNMKEENYAQISITFDDLTFDKKRIKALENKINRVIENVYSVINPNY